MTSLNPKRACEPCRRRKIKCDGLPTCRNCSVAETACHYSTPKKRGPKPAHWRNNRQRQRQNSTSVATESSGADDPPAQPPVDEALFRSPFDNSPVLGTVTANFLSESLTIQTETAVNIHLDLLRGLAAAAPADTVTSIANHCISLYTQYLFGAIPVCHEPTLRATASRYFLQPDDEDDHSAHQSRIFHCFNSRCEREQIAALREITILTALCASVAYAVPAALLPSKHGIAPLFLRAARSTLQIYEDYDLEHPNSSSLSIRLFLSSATQTETGKHGVAFHTLNEAGLIALRMRLYDESSLQGLDPIEETILRNAFWQLYVCDKTALVMKGRPITIHETLFESELTLQTRSRNCVPLFDELWESSNAAVEKHLLEGFHIIRRLWAMAAQVIQAMEDSNPKDTWNTFVEPEAARRRITQLSEAYFEMLTLTPNPPLDTETPESSPTDIGQETSHHPSRLLQRQQTSYLITLHCIKIFVMSSAVQSGMTEVLGLSAEPRTLAMKQIELAQEFLNVLHTVPFLHVQAEGEHCAEKIRRVGSLLLRLECSSEDDTVKHRAKDCTMRFIKILVQLDSKATDLL
ncbi:hypothetical protein IQ07DRAFT_584934 [Pyrenochaeta sp. DS3sAY3a]|nr:hypothetical protein IQ07DRAFT_584934 [Pyrenochaeta sp. DS3sAY3a]